MEEGEYLWDICSEALLLGDPASGSLSASDQARLDAARAVLYAAGDGGRLQDSPTVVAYKQYRDLQFAALQDYRNAQFTAEASTDPAVKSQWTTVDEPRLRQAVKSAEGAWETVGCKAKVEEAMQVEQACAARNPQMEWNAWKTDFLGDIDLETDTDRIRFAPTLFTPSNVFDSAWGRFTLTADEMAHLASAAPPELTDIFGTMPAGDVQSVSFVPVRCAYPALAPEAAVPVALLAPGSRRWGTLRRGTTIGHSLPGLHHRPGVCPQRPSDVSANRRRKAATTTELDAAHPQPNAIADRFRPNSRSRGSRSPQRHRARQAPSPRRSPRCCRPPGR